MTSLAVEVATRASEECFPGGVYWLTSDSDKGDQVLKDSISKVVSLLGINPADQTDEQSLNTLTSHLTKQGKCLLVIDNADAETFSKPLHTLINGVWVSQSQVSMLITSRLKENS